VEFQPLEENLKVSLHATLDDRYASIALIYGLDLGKWSILLLFVLQYFNLQTWNPLAIPFMLTSFNCILG
jgi:hypothetical protein